MKRLLIIHPIIAPYRVDVFNELTKAFDTEVYLTQDNLRSQKFDISELYKGLRFKPHYLLERYWNKTPKGLLKVMRKNSPDIVLVSEFGYATIIAIMFKLISRRKVRVVSMCDDSYDMIANDNVFSKRHKWARKLLVPWMDDVITVEPRVSRWYQKHYGKGMFMPIITSDERYRMHLSKALPLSTDYVRRYALEGKKVLLFVGRMVALKNVERALRVFTKTDIKNSVFVLVGDGQERCAWQDMYRQDNIIFTGRLEGEALHAWYNIANCFILASYQEPFGAVTNEALLGGCFSLISKLAGSNCLISEGMNGLTFDPHSEEDMERAIRRGLEQAKPCGIPLSLRDNMMNISFDERVNNMIDELNIL